VFPCGGHTGMLPAEQRLWDRIPILSNAATCRTELIPFYIAAESGRYGRAAVH
jgi:hypothetical protein